MNSQRPIAVVTGSSSGFGMLTCLELAKSGYFVIATMRNLAKASNLQEQADAHSLQDYIAIKQLDVTKEESIEKFRSQLSYYGEIDVLVNNAGYSAGGFVEDLTLEEFREQFETNFFGLVAITKLVIPIMREQRKGRIINVSSISGLMGFPGLSPYVASKHAVEGFSESLKLELKPFGIDVILVEPGSYETNIWDMVDTIKNKSKNSPYAFYLEKIEKHINESKKSYGDPQDVAKLITIIASQPYQKLRYPIGKGVKGLLMIKRIIPWKLWEKVFISKLLK